MDFHKREDPVTKEARARYVEGTYGTLQSSVWYMIDRLLVADPNHQPRFFSSPDFAEKNSPVSFLTSHMADTFMYITHLKPLEVRSIGYRQKLPSLSPIAVNGYDLVDTTILFEHGVLTHIITGWALPNTANSLTVQSARLLFSDCMLELWQDRYGYHEVTDRGIDDRNILFRNFEESGLVTGFGMDCPRQDREEHPAVPQWRTRENGAESATHRSAWASTPPWSANAPMPHSRPAACSRKGL